MSARRVLPASRGRASHKKPGIRNADTRRGPSDWFRTSGLVVPNHALYRLSYTRIFVSKQYQYTRKRPVCQAKAPLPPTEAEKQRRPPPCVRERRRMPLAFFMKTRYNKPYISYSQL